MVIKDFLCKKKLSKASQNITLIYSLIVDLHKLNFLLGFNLWIVKFLDLSNLITFQLGKIIIVL